MAFRRILGQTMAFLFLLQFSSNAQDHIEVSSSEILHDIEGLKSVGCALYMAAHPDDENTKVIAYLAQEMQLKTAYLALTRGDGGQNLIGTEKGDALGVLRTQELLRARSIDHGEQYFSRAIDFGYSKNPVETFNKWQRDEVLKDAVWVIRKLRPDIIITRFPPDARAGHGHHTASAILAVEAIEAANNPKFLFNDSRDGKLKPFKVHRVVWNTSIWWYKRTDTELDESKLYKLDVGKYNPLIGSSYNSIASRARSSHRSQGFGDLIDRGTYPEYFEHLAGDSAKKDIFEGLDFSWYRFGNYQLAENVTNAVNAIVASFNPARPDLSITKLLELKKYVKNVSDETWQSDINRRLDLIVARCAGLWCEVIVDQYYACEGDSVVFTLNAIKRNDCLVKTRFIDFGEFTYHIEEPTELLPNQLTAVVSKKIRIDLKDYGYSDPYWLKKKAKDGMFEIENAEMIGLAEHRPFQTATALFQVNDRNIEISVPITYKWEDRALGELRRPFEVRPKVFINFDEKVKVANAGQSITLDAKVTVNTPGIFGNLKLKAPDGWKVKPYERAFEGQFRGEVIPVTFEFTPSANAQSGSITAVVQEESNEYDRGYLEIKHDHIPTQIMMPKAECKLVYINVKTNGQKIGYLMGAGDEIPIALTQLGYEVEQLDPENINVDVLSQYKTVVLGVRAYNTIENIQNIHRDLLEYMDNGGKVIAQYNTTGGLKSNEVGPYGLRPSRNRITDEYAKLKILEKNHPIFNSPNKITENDFENWVQERGLYFPSDFDKKYTPLLEGNDQGEDPVNGMLLVANYGQGKFVYTGLSFFREVPAGVPGAYRLLVNLMEY